MSVEALAGDACGFDHLGDGYVLVTKVSGIGEFRWIHPVPVVLNRADILRLVSIVVAGARKASRKARDRDRHGQIRDGEDLVPALLPGGGGPGFAVAAGDLDVAGIGR